MVACRWPSLAQRRLHDPTHTPVFIHAPAPLAPSPSSYMTVVYARHAKLRSLLPRGPPSFSLRTPCCCSSQDRVSSACPPPPLPLHEHSSARMSKSLALPFVRVQVHSLVFCTTILPHVITPTAAASLPPPLLAPSPSRPPSPLQPHARLSAPTKPMAHASSRLQVTEVSLQ